MTDFPTMIAALQGDKIDGYVCGSAAKSAVTANSDLPTSGSTPATALQPPTPRSPCRSDSEKGAIWLQN